MKNTLVEFNNWLNTDDGKGCLTTSCEITEPVLYNRLRQAFYAGKEVNNFDKMKSMIKSLLFITDKYANDDPYEDQVTDAAKQLLESIK